MLAKLQKPRLKAASAGRKRRRMSAVRRVAPAAFNWLADYLVV